MSRATVSLSQFGNTVGYSYRYDQLNRLKRMRQHPLTIGVPSWDASTAGTAYQEDVTYDADGNRVSKVYTHGTQVDKMWYVRDVSGNVLAVYENKDGDGNVYWKEQQLYGTSRLGSWYPDLSINAGASGTATLWSATNKKQYELSNHLGNIVATVSDELKSDNTALVLSANNYYPFGMIQPDIVPNH
ncbi:hypothetical protein [Chitinophaga sp. LS1]|uniref:hypothetical protein n=1 Tax=Chitinophaga sp. LS1 TaxID=3051176 RepID=UPI002AAB5F17|nr:hypothetical protein [Chitinophaga sp. LS1]WPV68095.1 hypothetical protein QQL36_05075 [Chitinophaga sp. LS1]